MAAKDERPPLLQRRTPLAIVLAAALVAVGTLLVNRYVPDFLEAQEDPEPLAVAADYDWGLYSSCGWAARLPASISADDPPPSLDPEEVFEWVLASGGAPQSPVDVRVDLEGRRDAGVEVVAMTAVVAERDAELLGPEVYVMCEGEVAALEVGFDLDEPNPVARVLGEDDTLAGPYFSSGVLSIAKDEVVPILARAFSDSDTVAWDVEMTIRQDGQQSTIGTDAGFLTTGSEQLPTQEWWLAQAPPDGTLRWVPLWEVCTWFEDGEYERCTSELGRQP